MAELQFDMPVIFAGVVAFAIAMYVFLDGFDLGVGILFPFGTEDERTQMMDSIAPFWDGNETWLIMGGALLFAAFPVAYATLLPAFYVPVMLMLFALVFRGVAFEFRFKEDRWEKIWDWAFVGGSTLAAFSQGLILGGAISGVTIKDSAFAGGTFDWLTPFSVFTGLAMVVAYALLGATWLVMKAEGSVQRKGRQWAMRAMIGAILLIGVVSLWTPVAQPAIAERWFTWPQMAFFSPIPLLTSAAVASLWWHLRKPESEWQPFALAIALYLLSFAGLAISLWPYIVPRAITIHQAAATPGALEFTAYAVAVVMPMVLGYSAYSYWVFRGKTQGGAGYH